MTKPNPLQNAKLSIETLSGEQHLARVGRDTAEWEFNKAAGDFKMNPTHANFGPMVTTASRLMDCQAYVDEVTAEIARRS